MAKEITTYDEFKNWVIREARRERDEVRRQARERARAIRLRREHGIVRKPRVRTLPLQAA